MCVRGVGLGPCRSVWAAPGSPRWTHTPSSSERGRGETGLIPARVSSRQPGLAIHALRYSVDGIPVQPGEQKGLSLLLVLLVAVGQAGGGRGGVQTDRHDASQEREHLLQGRVRLSWVL